MVRRQKTKAKIEQAKEDEEEKERKAQGAQGSVIFLSSSDEDEANEDLSLEIVAKARMREAKRKREEDFDEFKASDGARLSGVIDISSTSSDEIEFLVDRSGGGDGAAANVADAAEVKRKKKKKKKKSKKIEEEEEQNKTVDAVEAQEQVENIGPVEAAVLPDAIREEEQVNPVEAVSTAILEETKTKTDEVCPVEAVSTNILEEKKTKTDGFTDNIIMRQYLRGPRYFDPPDYFIETCFNCNEEGHRAANCTAKKRKKPCFVCGSLDHSVRQCTQGLECFICQKKGHRKKDCPEKNRRIPRSCKICLRCGNLGHEMFSCSNEYALEDLKEITCYMCNKVGHLCCVDFVDTSPGEVSCYNCGQAGHYGLGCSKLRGETSGATATSATVCFRCGEEGHYKRGCPQKPKPALGIGESSVPTKTKRFPTEAKNKLGSHSAPHDLSKARKKKSTQLEEREFSAAKKSKQNTGRITDDPGDFPNRKAKAKNIWTRSPVTPPTRRNYNVTAGGYHPNSYSPWAKPKFHSGTPSHYGLPNNPYQHKFSASRFGNVPASGMGAPYHW